MLVGLGLDFALQSIVKNGQLESAGMGERLDDFSFGAIEVLLGQRQGAGR